MQQSNNGTEQLTFYLSNYDGKLRRKCVFTAEYSLIDVLELSNSKKPAMNIVLVVFMIGVRRSFLAIF